EDGIRDRNVTGVQTCALPISNQLVRDVVLVEQDGNGQVSRQVLHVVDAVAEQHIEVVPRELPLERAPELGGPKLPRPERQGRGEIGRASCRERGEEWGGGV